MNQTKQVVLLMPHAIVLLMLVLDFFFFLKPYIKKNVTNFYFHSELAESGHTLLLTLRGPSCLFKCPAASGNVQHEIN